MATLIICMVVWKCGIAHQCIRPYLCSFILFFNCFVTQCSSGMRLVVWGVMKDMRGIRHDGVCGSTVGSSQ